MYIFHYPYPIILAAKCLKEAIRQSSDNLLVVLNDILDLSKIEAGKMEVESIPIKPAEKVKSVVDVMLFKAEEKGLTLSPYKYTLRRICLWRPHQA